LKNAFPSPFFHRFHETLNSYHPVSAETTRQFLDEFEPVSFKKGEVLLRQGEVCKHLYYILKGGVRCFMLDENGKEVNLHFYFEDELASEFKSLRSEEPSERNLVAMVPTKALKAAKPDYIPVLESNIEFMQAALRFFQEKFLQEEEHSEMLRKLSAEERYQHILNEQPHLLQRVSLTQLSSWLGLSRESLSRIRSKISS
jgi:CRP-like cAMP-binding protein